MPSWEYCVLVFLLKPPRGEFNANQGLMDLIFDNAILLSAIADASSSIVLYPSGRSEFVMGLNPVFFPLFSSNSFIIVASAEVQATISLTFLSIPRDSWFSGITVARKDRKSTRLNSSHANISYAVFCLKKK